VKIAVTYSNGLIEQHFGQTKEFKVYTIEDNKIVNQEIVSTLGYAHGTLINLLVSNQINTLICGGLGQGAKDLLSRANISLLPGVNKSADEAVNDYINNSLNYDPNVACAGGHHDHESSHGEGHKCNH